MYSTKIKKFFFISTVLTLILFIMTLVFYLKDAPDEPIYLVSAVLVFIVGMILSFILRAQCYIMEALEVLPEVKNLTRLKH